MGVVLWEAATQDGRPPVISVSAGPIHEQEGGYAVEIIVGNSGEIAAAQVIIEGSLRQGNDIVETSEASFDHVASRSQRRGGLYFRHDPRSLELQLRALGYVEP
jgi:uncharacterized protein (TIGR02588 family)